jgi:hypothetical protein
MRFAGTWCALTYAHERGPARYAVGGEVGINAGPTANDPEYTPQDGGCHPR